jgi:hypothetical protein
MKKLYVASCVALLALVVGCGGTPSDTAATTEVTEEQAPAPEAVADVRHDMVYACDCGDDCDCNTLTTAPGTCECGNELKAAHVVKVEENEALLCTCEAGCTCEIDAEDETKCGCGSDVKRVSFEGTGLYYCNCGGSCTCNYVSTEAGKCSCGMDLVTSTT